MVWARAAEGVVGFLVERGTPGYGTADIHGKWSMRASVTSSLSLADCRVKECNRLPGAKGLKAALSCLTQARFGIGWGVIGAAMDCYETARQYSIVRKQFDDRPIASHQLVQEKLAWMITEITKAQLLNWRLGVLMNDEKATPQQISMAKRNGCEIAANIAREARQMLGGAGITGEYSIMRHMMNIESVITYEGTHDIHLLITGMDVTGFNAFK
jgi:glutaryl-CoA dehydrogenase